MTLTKEDEQRIREIFAEETKKLWLETGKDDVIEWKEWAAEIAKESKTK